jgi:PST family polysaccharide transporter
MASGRRALLNVFWLTLEPAVRLVVSIPLAGFVAGRLGLTGYGQFSLALSLSMAFVPLAHVGLNESLQRAVAQKPPEVSRLWSSVLAGKLVVVVLYVGLLALLAVLLGYGTFQVSVVTLTSLYLGFTSFESTNRALLSGRQEMKVLARLDLWKLAADVAVTVGVLGLGAGVLGYSWARVLLGAGGFLVALRVARRRFGVRLERPAWQVLRPLLVPALSFLGIGLIRSFNARSGVVVLDRLRGVEAVALYGAALSIVDRLLVFLPAVEFALFPFFSAMAKEDRARFAGALARAIRYELPLATWLGLGVALGGPLLIRFVFPAGFAGVGPVLEILGLALALRALNGFLGAALSARHLERGLAVITFVQCAVNLGAAVWLAPGHGAVGLAWAAVVSEGMAVLAIGTLLGAHGYLGRVTWLPAAAAVGSGPLVFFGVRLLAPWLGSGPGAVLGAVAYLPLLLVVGGLSRADVEYVRGLLTPSAGSAREP